MHHALSKMHHVFPEMHNENEKLYWSSILNRIIKIEDQYFCFPLIYLAFFNLPTWARSHENSQIRMMKKRHRSPYID